MAMDTRQPDAKDAPAFRAPREAAVQRVELGERSYDIRTGFDTLAACGAALRERLTLDRVVVITNQLVGGHYADALLAGLDDAGFAPKTLTLPDGEIYKSPDTLNDIYDFLIDHHLTRDTILVALGGGVVGDITGYAAATYVRGIPYVQVPTTLLAMVDSSVGGKTAVNHPRGKNMIGAFYQPALVFIDCATLKTLEPAEFRAGFAEVIKYGVIWDAEFFDYCREQRERIFALDPAGIAHIVTTSCAIKAKVVSEDEREAGLRAILNFGHTAGHALEAATNYRHYKHGEAVAVGMVAAARIAHAHGLCAADVPERIEEFCRDCGLPVRITVDVEAGELVDRMQQDKKTRGGKIHLVLPTAIGKVELRDDVPRETIVDALQSLKAE